MNVATSSAAMSKRGCREVEGMASNLANRILHNKTLMLLLQSRFVIDLAVRHLRSFLSVAEELHFGHAAERLGIAQSALSQQVRRLEDAVGAQLLTRTSRRVALTPAGEVLADGAGSVLLQLERIVQQTRAAQAGEIGTIVIGAQGAALATLVPSIIAALTKRAPGLQVDLRQLTSEEQAAGLLSGALDAGLVREVAPRPNLETEMLLEEPVHAVVSASHPLAERSVIDLSELAHEPFVLWRRAGSPAFFDQLTAACRAAGFSPTIAYEMRGIEARLGLVGAGLGVALEAASYAPTSRTNVRFLSLSGNPITARIQLAWTPLHANPRRDLLLTVARETAHR